MPASSSLQSTTTRPKIPGTSRLILPSAPRLAPSPSLSSRPPSTSSYDPSDHTITSLPTPSPPNWTPAPTQNLNLYPAHSTPPPSAFAHAPALTPVDDPPQPIDVISYRPNEGYHINGVAVADDDPRLVAALAGPKRKRESGHARRVKKRLKLAQEGEQPIAARGRGSGAGRGRGRKVEEKMEESEQDPGGYPTSVPPYVLDQPTGYPPEPQQTQTPIPPPQPRTRPAPPPPVAPQVVADYSLRAALTEFMATTAAREARREAQMAELIELNKAILAELRRPGRRGEDVQVLGNVVRRTVETLLARGGVEQAVQTGEGL